MDSYSIEVKLSKQEDGLWRAEVPALQGCFVDGVKLHEVLRDIQDVAAMFIDIELERGEVSRPVKSGVVEGMTLRLPVIVSEHSFRRVGKSRPRSKSATANVS
jgi:predicted RNase H-like HicB family nuclease